MSLRECLLVLILVILSFPIFADDDKHSWPDDISINGFLSVAYSYNFNTPASATNQFRVFDFDDNSFKLDVAELVLQKAVAKPGDAGFRVDFEAGASIPRVIASNGLFRDPVTGVGEDFDIQQAYISYNAPIGKGLRFDFGKYVTHTGAEVIEGYDGFNDNYSRSLLFGFAIPFTHTGLRASYTFNDHVSAMACVVNGWDNVKDNNSAKTFGGQLTLIPVKNLTFYVNYLGGPERNNDNDDSRHLFDLVSVWKPVNKVTLTLNYDYGNDANAVAPGQDATWDGVAGYVRFQAMEKFALVLRVETLHDSDGFRTGVAQRINEFTITPEYRFNEHFIVRGDLRSDSSNQDVFQKENDSSGNPQFKGRQTTIAANAIYLF
ncbi:MAG: hypothetical protein C5B54_05845 [Acidobacteria bacterium]|nr:MAG: hypothetical protein C5B54_05845 [Acidobacteriota bacterium]